MVGRGYMTSEEFIMAYIESDILDETSAEWIYVADNGESQMINSATTSAKSYMQFINSLHSIIKRLKTSKGEEYSDYKVYVVRGMDR